MSSGTLWGCILTSLGLPWPTFGSPGGDYWVSKGTSGTHIFEPLNLQNRCFYLSKSCFFAKSTFSQNRRKCFAVITFVGLKVRKPNFSHFSSKFQNSAKNIEKCENPLNFSTEIAKYQIFIVFRASEPSKSMLLLK